jgi:hypothetical protein
MSINCPDMKKTPYITMLVCGALAFGCTRTEITPVTRDVAVKLSGELSPAGALTRGDGMIDPILANSGDLKGLPPKQLSIGIVTIETSSDAPTAPDWGLVGNSPYLDKGFFGGNELGDTPTSMTPEDAAWNGNIEFLNEQGTGRQDVFYDPTGDYYHFVGVYPYAAITGGLSTSSAGATVLFNIDGSQDIMASNSGRGNIDHPFAHDNHPDDVLTFSHKLTALRCRFVAESAVAKALYGTINSVKLVGQPDVVGLDIGANALDPTTPLTDERTAPAGISYPAVGTGGVVVTTPLTLSDVYTSADAVEFGYIMALPQQTYTFEIVTSVHGANNPLTVTYDFTAAAMPAAGTIYNLTFTMLETAKIELVAAPATEWWLDQTFD